MAGTFTAAIDLSTIGMKVGIAFETVSGTRPTAQYYNLQKPKSIPDMNPAPEAIDTTSLNATKNKTSIPGLLDLSQSMAISFGMSQVLIDTWNNVCDTWDKNKESGLRPWLEFYHPNLASAYFVPIEPARLGIPAAEVNAAWNANVNFAIAGEIVSDTKVDPVDEDFPAPVTV